MTYETASSKEQAPIVEIVNKILKLTLAMDYSSDLIRQKSVKGCQERIDAIVYELYGLTDDEIKIVEEATVHK